MGGLSAPLLVWLCTGAAWRWGWVCTHVCASIHPSPLEAPASSEDNQFEADVTTGSQQAPYLLGTVVCGGVGTPTPGAEPAWGWQRGEGTGVLRVGLTSLLPFAGIKRSQRSQGQILHRLFFPVNAWGAGEEGSLQIASSWFPICVLG